MVTRKLARWAHISLGYSVFFGGGLFLNTSLGQGLETLLDDPVCAFPRFRIGISWLDCSVSHV